MTYDDLLRIDRECAWYTYRQGTDWRYMGEKGLQRAKLVLVDGMRQCDVAKAEGVSPQTISAAVRRARRGAAKLGLTYNARLKGRP